MSNQSIAIKQLGELSIEEFLTHYWQKKPLVIRNQFPDFRDVITPEELAGLALEEDVESRVIQQLPSDDTWTVETGPFDESEFLNLPDSHWTLLVQTVDQWIPEAKEWLSQFSFIPQWRVDDLMVSFATPNGGVGPHIDQYDVFLIQGMGSRHWQVGKPGQALKQHTPHPLLKQTESFKPIIDCVLNTGDMLYIPPNTAHNGIAVENCLTYSVGFRAPSHQSTMEQLLVDLLEQEESQSTRYADTNPRVNFSSNELPRSVFPWLRQALESITDEQLVTAFGKLVTRPKYSFENDELENDKQKTQDRLKSHEFKIALAEDCRVTYVNLDSRTLLFINGDVFHLPLSFHPYAEKLAAHQPVFRNELKSLIQDVDFIEGIANLVNRGHLTVEFE